MFVVDTNIFVYAANSSAPEQAICRRCIEEWRHGDFPWYITWNIIYEFLRVVTHPSVFLNPWNIEDAWSYIEALCASPSLGILVHSNRHSVVAVNTLRETSFLRGNLIHDLHTAVLMREYGIRQIYTRDNDFHRFPFVEVIDPLANV